MREDRIGKKRTEVSAEVMLRGDLESSLKRGGKADLAVADPAPGQGVAP